MNQLINLNLFSGYLNGKFSDFELILKDNDNEIILPLHKVILSALCPYFSKLLSFNNNENKQQIMIVDNAMVMRDVIYGLYGLDNSDNNDLPNWLYTLEKIKCQHYLCLDVDETELYRIVVPEEGFDFFLEILGAIGIDSLLHPLKKNLPKNYDLSKFPSEITAKLSTQNTHIISCADFKIQYSDIVTGSVEKEFIDHTDEINCIAVTCDKKILVSSSNDDTIKVWDIETEKLLHTIKEHTADIWCVAISKDDKLIISGSDDLTIKIFELETGNLVRTICTPDCINSLEISSDNQKILSATDNYIYIWDIQTGNVLQTLFNYTNNTNIARYFDNEKFIISGGWDKKIKIWDCSSGELIKEFGATKSFVNDIAVSINGVFIAIAYDEYIVKIYNNNLKQHDHISCSAIPRTVSFSTRNHLIAIGYDDGTISMYDIIKKQVVNTNFCHRSRTNCVIFV